jgi:acyl dehydratase
MTMPERRVLWAMTRNAFSRRMNRERVGRVFERPVERPAPDAIRAFAAATGDDPSRYSGGDPTLPPMFIARLAFPLVQDVMTCPGLGLNLLRMVHGEQGMTWRRPVRGSEPLRVSAAIRDIRDTPAGELLDLVATARVGDEPVGEAVVGMLVRGRRSGERKRREPPPDPSPERFRVDVPLAPDQALRYAEASLDRNPIHTSDRFARIVGLPRAIVHGMCVFALAANVLVDRVGGGDPARLRALRGRFAHPALPGETLRLTAFDPVDGEIPFEMLDPRGRKVLRDGRAVLADG